MATCAICTRQSAKALCLLCGSETDSICKKCASTSITVCTECYEKYRILNAIDALKDKERFTFNEFKNEAKLDAKTFSILRQGDFIDKDECNNFECYYRMNEKAKDFMEVNSGFKLMVNSLINEKKVRESFVKSIRDELPIQVDKKNHNKPKRIKKSKQVKCPNCNKRLENKKRKSSGLCKTCSRSLHALESLETMLENFKPEEEFNVDKVTWNMNEKERTAFLDIIWTLEEFRLLEYNEIFDTHKLKPKGELNRFIRENEKLKDFVDKKPAKIKIKTKTSPKNVKPVKKRKKKVSKKIVEKGKKCPICGKVKLLSDFYITVDGPDECKECAHKKYGAEALKEIRKLVEPGIEFTVDDLAENRDRIEILGYLWTLQEFNLVEKDPAFEIYTLKPESELKKFHDLYGEGELPSTSEITKTCPLCNRTLHKSSFYSTGDGTRNECKECSDKVFAWEVFLSIRKLVGDKHFKREELLESFDDPQFLDANIWSLQEYGLIDEKNGNFVLKPKRELEKMYSKYTRLVSKEEKKATPTLTPGEEHAHKKEIIYIKPESDENHYIIMNGIISGNGLIKTMDEISPFIPSMRKCMILKEKDYFEVLIELKIKNESVDEVLKLLEENMWENKVSIDSKF